MNISVKEYIEGASEDASLRRAQVRSAGTIISQFLLVREGLKDDVVEAQLDSIAATLTVGIWAKNSD